MARNRLRVLSLGFCLLLLAPGAHVAPRPAAVTSAPLPNVAAGPESEAQLGAVPTYAALLARLDRSQALTEDERQRVAEVILESASLHRVSPHLVLAVIHVESAYQPFAISNVGALGLMQVMPRTGAEVAERIGVPWRGRQTLFDPEDNIRIGVAYLRELLDRYEDVRTALAAYNWGPGRIDTRLRRGGALPAQYADRVMGAFSRVARASVGS